jgi:hypothetical protein
VKRHFLFFLIAAALTSLAVSVTFFSAVEFSTFAAEAVGIGLALGAFYAYTRFVLADKIDFIQELKSGNIAVGIFLLAIALLVSAGVASAQPAHLDSALAYAQLKQPLEIQPNAGPYVDKFLQTVNISQPAPWCAAFVSYCLDAAGASLPVVRSASSRAFINRRSISATLFLRGAYRPPAGTIVVWKNGETPFGHVGFVVRNTLDQRLVTVEGNTSPGGQASSQREGDGVYIRQRSVLPGNFFRITHFTEVHYVRSGSRA